MSILESNNIWNEIKLRPLLGEIKRKYGTIDSLALPSILDLPSIRIETLFVPPYLTSLPVSADSHFSTWPDGETLLDALEENLQLVVLGDPGGGKTTLSNWLAWRLSSGSTIPLPSSLQHRLPMPCVLREMQSKVFENEIGISELAIAIYEKLLGNELQDSLISIIKQKVRVGAYVLILDGVDEIPVSSRSNVSNWIKEAHKNNGCVLATSRIVGYEDYPVDQPISEAHDSVSSSKFFAKIKKNHNASFKNEAEETNTFDTWASKKYLMPFNDSQIATFAENWYRQRYTTLVEAKEKTQDFLSSVYKSEVTHRLARTPNLLSLMAIVHRERAHLPDGKAELYEEITNAYINTIDQQRKIAPGDILLKFGWKERRAWLSFVGFKMQELRDASDINDKSFQNSGVIVREEVVLTWLREAMNISDVNDAESAAQVFLEWVARRSGLLLPRGEERYSFVHLSFQEYFCACFLNDKIVSPAFIKNNLGENAIVTPHKLKNWAQLSNWRETFIFVFEIISSERDAEWVDDLALMLFGLDEIKQTVFQRNISKLAAKAVSDKHIKLSIDRRDAMVNRCMADCWDEWLSLGVEDSYVLNCLVDSGYVVIIVDNKKLNKSYSLDFLHSAGLNYIIRSSDVIEKLNPETLKVFIANDSGFKSVDFLKNFKKLQWINLNSTQVSSIRAVENLNELILLDIGHTKVSSLKPIANITTLRQLVADRTKITDISPLASLSDLEYLSLRSTSVVDFNVLSMLPKLTALDVSEVKVKDSSQIFDAFRLEALDCSNAEFETISIDNDNYVMRDLKLAGVSLCNYDFLSKLKSLVSLDLSFSNFIGQSGLFLSSSLTHLNLSCSDVNNLDFIGNSHDITSLDISNTLVGDARIVGNLSLLSYLNIEQTLIDNFDFLGNLTNLDSLTLRHTLISDLSPISKLSNLRYLHLAGTKKMDLSPLSNLNSLRMIFLDNPDGYDFSPLRNLKNLAIHSGNGPVNFR